ncbi:unnamed protein product [Nippostrongylus brasiliensis]|uniref:Fas-binding factor 1 homolog n=1 Tax=Nippostrongylus brasiliensis TaxID=27835 RepID=A0A158QWR1_NIPBR|nr:unnamed protein product [Nippostrongylus brasiliensis]
MDDLDSALFGKPVESKAKPTLGNIDSLFGEPKKTPAKRAAVSFLDASPAAATTSEARARSTLDDLFTDKPATQPTTTSTSAATSTIRKKDDENDLEKLWKSKLSKKDDDHRIEIEDLENTHQKQISKLNNDHAEELERMKIAYERQLNTVQQSAEQFKDVSSVVNKVDNLSSSIQQLAGSVTATAERSVLDKEAQLRAREDQLEHREQRFEEEKRLFDNERKELYQLNARLKEWSRLNAEKQAFKEDQQSILQHIEKQMMAIETSKSAFFNEQHDLILRITAERQLLEHDKNEFHGKRSVDVKRLKEEASELQWRAQQILLAEKQIEDMKKHYEKKVKQLQDLEISLMEECLEMENLRNHPSRQPDPKEIKGMAHRYIPAESSLGRATPQSEQPEFPLRSENATTVLKKHAEFLERYMGQKVQLPMCARTELSNQQHNYGWDPMFNNHKMNELDRNAT